MTKYKFLKKPSETDEFSEASVHELRVLVALYESRGELDEAAFVERTGTSRARLTSALALWQESGVIAERGENEPECETSFWGSRITDEFPERTVPGELEEESATDIARTIRNNKLASLFDECAAMMHKTMLTPAEIRRLSELSSQYELTEEYIAMLAAHLAGENMLSVGILVKRAMTLVGHGVANVEALADYISQKEKERSEFAEYRRVFGIYNRSLTKSEREYIEKWSREYAFGTEIVGMAYDITVMNTSKLSFAYMDKLLADWHSAGCKTLADCEKRYDEHHRELEAEAEAKRAKTDARRGTEKKKPAPRFGDFDPEEAFRLALSRSFASDGDSADNGDGKE